MLSITGPQPGARVGEQLAPLAFKRDDRTDSIDAWVFPRFRNNDPPPTSLALTILAFSYAIFFGCYT